MSSQTKLNAVDSSLTVCDKYDIAEEIERACIRLHNAMNEEEAARDSLKSLLKKRKEDAREAVKQAQLNLEFVKKEENRVFQKLMPESDQMEECPQGDALEGKGENPGPHLLPTPQSKSIMRKTQKPKGSRVTFPAEQTTSLLMSYIEREKDSLQRESKYLVQFEEEAHELRQLIAKYETASSRPPENSSSHSNSHQLPGALTVRNDPPTNQAKTGIDGLKKALSENESGAKYFLEEVRKREELIASYLYLAQTESI